MRTSSEGFQQCYNAQVAVNGERLAKTCNRSHEPKERDLRIARLRELHDTMDPVVLNAYGWREVPTDCQFLDREIGEEEEAGRRRKPWRYCWPAAGDEVLACLLTLNVERIAEERFAGATTCVQR